MDTSIKKRFLHFALPSIAAMWVYSLYTMVDGFFVSKFVGNEALSSINIALPFVNTLFALSIIFGVGTSTTIGMLLGRNERERACQVFSFTAVVLLIFSILLVVLIRFNLSTIVSALGAEGEIFSQVMDYLNIILFFIPFFMVSYHFEVLVKIDGFPRLATLGVISSAITNGILDYLFVGVFSMGLKGAAIATGVAQVFSTALFLIHFLRAKGRLVFTPFKFEFSLLRKILPLGVGDFLSEFSTGFIVFLYNRFLLMTLGNQAIVSYTVISYVNLLVAVTMAGLTQGMQPLMSYHYGKKNIQNCKKLFKYALISIGCLSFAAIILTNIFTENIVSLFIRNNEELLNFTIISLRRYSLSFLLLGFNLLLIGFFASIGHARGSILLSLSRGFIVIYLSLILTTKVLPLNLIWYSSLISEGISLIFGLILLKLILKTENVKAFQK